MEILEAIAFLKAAILADPDFSSISKPDNPPGQLVLPGLVTYVSAGGFGSGSLDEDRWGAHTIVAEIHVARADLGRAYAELMAFWVPLTRIVFAAAATHFGGHVALIGDAEGGSNQRPITYTIEPDQWSNVPTLALAYQIVVTTQEGARDD